MKNKHNLNRITNLREIDYHQIQVIHQENQNN